MLSTASAMQNMSHKIQANDVRVHAFVLYKES